MRQVILSVSTSGSGGVLVSQTQHVCHHICRIRVAAPANITLTAKPASGSHFVRWTGACSVHPRCVIRVTRARAVIAHFALDTGLVSWNRFYKCKPKLATIPSILGSQQSPLGGATEAGGHLQPHLRGPEDQHVLSPPCSIGGTGTFVELHDVAVAAAPEQSADGDLVVNLVDPNRSDITNVNMKTIHSEIDHILIVNRVAPPMQPAAGTHIDVQGFVYWDEAHTGAAFHSFSGWEIHTVTAWRRTVPTNR